MSEIIGNIPAKQTAVGNIGTVYGKDGLSAYQIAIKDGFVGTEKEWLESLKGKPGYTPVRGVDYWTVADKAEVKHYIDKNAGADTIVSNENGSVITIKDASNRNFQGLKIYGNYTEESGVVGENGSVTVNVGGKNIADVQKFSVQSPKTPTSETKTENTNSGTTLTNITEKTVTVTQSKWPASTITSWENGYFSVGFYCPLKIGDMVTISFNYISTANPLNKEEIACFLNGTNQGVKTLKNADTGLYYYTATIAEASQSNEGWNYMDFHICGKSGVFSNFQIEYGNAFTGYEEYKEPQTLTVPTPNGLDASNGRYDEIDFAKGVYIQRVGIDGEEETPLSDDVLAAYAKLHTYKPNTVITNDYGAEMSVEYVADTKIYIDNKFSELAATLTALTGV